MAIGIESRPGFWGATEISHVRLSSDRAGRVTGIDLYFTRYAADELQHPVYACMLQMKPVDGEGQDRARLVNLTVDLNAQRVRVYEAYETSTHLLRGAQWRLDSGTSCGVRERSLPTSSVQSWDRQARWRARGALSPGSWGHFRIQHFSPPRANLKPSARELNVFLRVPDAEELAEALQHCSAALWELDDTGSALVNIHLDLVTHSLDVQEAQLGPVGLRNGPLTPLTR